MTHCKRFLECKEKLGKDPEIGYNHVSKYDRYLKSDCSFCQRFDNHYEPDVKLESPEPKVIIKNVTLAQHQQLLGQVQYLKQKLQTVLSDKKKKISKYD